jgi:hypothetical protein
MNNHTTGRFSAATTQMLLDSGWFPGRDVLHQLALPPGFTPFPAALNVLKEFGNLDIGNPGSGIECARTPVTLNPTLAIGETDRFEAFRQLLKISLYPLGETRDGHAFIAIDQYDRVFLAFDDLYFVGDTFEQALDNLLTGTSRPRIVREDGAW